MNWLFFVLDRTPGAAPNLTDSGVSCETWRPGRWRVKPTGFPVWPFFVWWMFHQLHLFANRGYCVILIRRRGEIVHRSCVFPRYFRFPFMSHEDLQVGDTWTAPEHRGLGLAVLGLRAAAKVASDTCPHLWYLVEEQNSASIRAVEKAGFRRVGRGCRTARFGSRLFGSFVIKQTVQVARMASAEGKEGAVAES